MFRVVSTGELTNEEISSLCELFTTVYGKPCPEDLFRRKFAAAPLGGAIHSLMFVEDKLVGAFSAIPLHYNWFGETRIFAITADLMIHPQFRGNIPRLQRLAEGLYSRLTGEGVAFVFCCLRDEIFKVHAAISRWRAIGRPQYYVAPLRLPWLGAATRLLRPLLPLCNRLIGVQPAGPPAQIAKVAEAAFLAWRYSIFPSAYKTVELGGGASAIYAADLFYPIEGVPKGIRLGLLLDVTPLTQEAFDHAVRAIRRADPSLSLLAYQGILPFTPREMLVAPAKYEPQKWTIAGRILRPAEVDERIFEAKYWNVNLSNGDLV